jgi:hypothetical protein
MTDGLQRVGCPRCGAEIALYHRPMIDAQLIDRFLSGPLNPTSCERCGLPVDAATPCLVDAHGWSGVVLANPEAIGIGKAVEVVDYFVRRVAQRREGSPILVVGAEHQMRRMLRRDAGERFNAVPFPHFLCREWENQIEHIKVAADACMAAGQAELAYWWLIEAVGMYNELYLHPMMKEVLELAVLAAGDRIAPNLKEPRTAAADFARVQQILEPIVPETPPWFDSAYLCFYDDDHDFKGGPATFASELTRIGAHGEVGFDQSELHVTTTTVQAIGRSPVPIVDRATVGMLTLMLIGELSSQGIPIRESDRSLIGTIEFGFRLAWDELLRSADRYQIYKRYQQLTGGKDILLEWRLEPHGLILAMDRFESGGDPRF